MTDKEKQIEEMVEVIKAQSVKYNANCDKDCDDCPYGDCVGKLAEELLKASYRKIPEGSVVLSEGEYSDILEDEVETLERDIAEYWVCLDIDAVAQELHKDGYRKLDDHAIMTLRKAKGLEERTRKETARDILKFVDKKLDLYQNGVIGGSLYDDGYKSAVQEIKFSIKKQFGVEVE